GVATGDVDIIADVRDRMNDTFTGVAAPLSVGYYVLAAYQGSHDVKSAANPYVLARFDDNWFSGFVGDTQAARRDDARYGVFPLVYAPTLRVPNHPNNAIKTQNFIVTNTNGTDGGPASVVDRYWRTNALDDGAANDNAHANYWDRNLSARNATAR